MIEEASATYGPCLSLSQMAVVDISRVVFYYFKVAQGLSIPSALGNQRMLFNNFMTVPRRDEKEAIKHQNHKS